MSTQEPRPTGKSQRKNLLLTAGFVLLLLLLILGAGYLLTLQPPASEETGTRLSADGNVGPPTDVSSQGALEGAPEDNAPGTQTPGFIDDFENGLASVWTVHFGDPIAQEGRLTSHVGAGLAAGDPSWKNYQVEFDVDTGQNDCSFTDTSNSVGVRVQDFDHAYWFVFNGCEAAWSLFAGGVQDGALNVLPDTTVKTKNAQTHITIRVDANKMSAYENGTLISSIIDSQWRTGGVFLQVEAQTFYDNFQVSLLP